MKTKKIIILLVIILEIIFFLYSNFFYKKNLDNQKEVPIEETQKINKISLPAEEGVDDQLEDWQLKILEDADLDTTTTYEDLLLPDGTSMFEWSCKNDREYLKLNHPDRDKRCTELGF